VPSKRDRRRAILADEPTQQHQPEQPRLVLFGSSRHPADRCTYTDTPAEFARCLECQYNQGAQGSGIMCAHRFGLDPTLVDGIATQFRSGDILPLND